METKEKVVAEKKTILQEAKVVCEPHWMVTAYCRDEEARARNLEDWCKDFNAFIRDHRHQDGTRLSVERIYADICSACGADWETMPAAGDGPEACAHCGVPTGN